MVIRSKLCHFSTTIKLKEYFILFEWLYWCDQCVRTNTLVRINVPFFKCINRRPWNWCVLTYFSHELIRKKFESDMKLKASLSQSVNVLIVKNKHTEIYGHNRAYLWFLKQHLPLITPYVITCRLHSLMFCTSYTGKTPSTFCFISFSVCILLTQPPTVILSHLPLI